MQLTTQSMTDLTAPLITQQDVWSINDLNNPALYLNREFTWLNFCERVLSMAADDNTPLLERVKFLAIVGSNLDEFFMKRIGGLYQQNFAGISSLSMDGLTPMEQILTSVQYVNEIQQKHRLIYRQLQPLLGEHGIHIVAYKDLDTMQQAQAREYFIDHIYPLVTPQAIDPAHPFPFVSNLSMNLLISVRVPGEDDVTITRIKVPISQGIKRFININALHGNSANSGNITYVPLEEILRENLDILLPGMEIIDTTLFRVTRNAITEKSEEQAEDLLELIESELRERRFAPIVRLQIEDTVSDIHKAMLIKFLGVDAQHDVFYANDLFGSKNLMELMAIDRPELKDHKHMPIDNVQLHQHNNIFAAIQQHGSILLHHPYDAFGTSVERLLKEASRDPRVQAIKMTLYRTSDDSMIIHHLIEAAQNGKQVAVVMEIKATFDESANIRWAQHLEQSGIHVTYGIVGLKTHCKLIHVVRREGDKLVRYNHIGTGNYHSDTARLYTDMGLLTNDPEVGADLTELFNYLTTGFNPKREYHRISPAPKHLKPEVLAWIEKAIHAAQQDKHAEITLKTNALEDGDVTAALYRASMAGVTVNLLVRDTCRIRPGLAGLSDNIRVRSVVGRFLEHSRIYQFEVDEAHKVYIGSADLMKRNLESRVEVMIPVEAPELKTRLREILQQYWQDNQGAWEMNSDGSFRKIAQDDNDEAFSIQQHFIDAHDDAFSNAKKQARRKTQSLNWLPGFMKGN